MAAMTPGLALNNLRQALAAHDVTTTGMTITRLAGTLYPERGSAISYHCGLYWWPTRRRHGSRPICAIHDARDPAGAARRITRASRPDG
jgi:hypothetical protein